MRKVSAVLITSLALVIASLFTPPVAMAAEGGFPLYRTAYDGTIYELVTYDDGSQVPEPISFEEWGAVYNYATPSDSPTDYVKYAWSNTVYAVTFWPGGEDRWSWQALDYGQWQSASFPFVRNAGWIKGSYYYKWATSNELFVEGQDGVNHKLTADEWRESGYRAFVDRANEGFQKLSWSPEIVRLTNLGGGQGYAINGNEWREEAFPTPQIVSRMTGDTFYKEGGSPTIYYAGPGVNRAITAVEWAAAGYPQPALRSTFIPGNAGTLFVGSEVAAGTYRSQGNNGCYWARRSGAGFENIISNNFGNGQAVVTIEPSDRLFETSRCGDWRSTSISSGPMLATIPGDGGTFIVGSDVSPGTYRSLGNDGCYWARTSSFSGLVEDILDNDFVSGSVVVTIQPSDRGFESSSCGNWERIG